MILLDPPSVLIVLVIMGILAVIAYKGRIVTKSGLVAAFFLGIIVWLLTSWTWFIILLIFFVITAQFTHYKYKMKRQHGAAQEKGGARDWSHVLANGGLPLSIVLVGVLTILLFGQMDAYGRIEVGFGSMVVPASIVIAKAFVAFLGAIATATADTLATEIGLLKPGRFDLEVLSKRGVKHGNSFTCKGSKGNCDRSCKIAMIEIEKKTYPFGGACNRYYNLRHHIKFNVEKLDLIRVRQGLIFEKYGAKAAMDAGQDPIFKSKDGLPDKKVKKLRGRIGINKSFLVNTYYPLYSTFFAELGFEPVIPDCFSQEGIDQTNAAFCYPGELAHGVILAMATGGRLGIVLPSASQIPHAKERRNDRWPGLDVVITSASPYVRPEKRGEEWGRAVEKLQAAGVDLVYLDCMGMGEDMKRTFREATQKPVILARSLAARIVGELIGSDE